MENKITRENTEKDNRTMSAEELTALAKENGFTLSEDDAKAYFGQLKESGEISDEELSDVAGGGCNLPGGHGF